MANLLDYLTWRGDLSFRERPLNEVDNLIFSELAYVDMSHIVPSPALGGFVSVRELAHTYVRLGRKQDDLFFNDPVPLLLAAGESARFGEVRVGRYVNHIDSERQVQFSAMVFLLPEETVYVAYRGTDNSVVGWREDFNFSFGETEGQKESVAYLLSAADALPGPLIIGGHSKGGNLAVYAAAFSGEAIRPRIRHVYTNDGPGFVKALIAREEYQSLLDRMDLIVPETSVVGILLSHLERKKVIKSDASGVMQHNPMSWQVLGAAFEEVDSQSSASVFMDRALQEWLSDLDEEQRKAFVDALFDAMDASGAKTLFDLSANWRDSYSALLRSLFELEPERRGEMMGMIKKLASAGQSVFLSDARAAIREKLDQAAKRLKLPSPALKAGKASSLSE